MFYLVIASLFLGAALIVVLALAAANTPFLAGNLPLLFGLTGFVVMLLGGLFVYQVFTLWRRIKVGVFGARLTAKMFTIFGVMALVPGLVVYGVSVQFLVRSIESWFDLRVEGALASGLSLGQSAIKYLEVELVHKSEGLSRQLEGLPPILQLSRLNELRESAGVSEVSLFDREGRLLGFASADPGALLPNSPEASAIWQARLQQAWSRVETGGGAEGGLGVRVVVPVNMLSLHEDLRLLQVVQRAPDNLARDALQVEEAYRGYQELALSRLGLKRQYGLSLTIVLALALFSALALAFVLSERLSAPLRALARGTRAVARGDFSKVQAVASRDELGMLTQSFNRMTQQLSEARSEAQESHDQALETKAYLESVLGSVSTGVVTLDPALRVRLVNPAAASLLGSDRHALEDQLLDALGEPESSLRSFGETTAARFRETASRTWQDQVEFTMAKGTRLLLARGSPLTAAESADLALVFDDVTQLVQAQRDAAWGEVARRLAHEIKNPLTPIQLSAERLQVKLADKLDEPGRQVLNRAADTIVNQVAAMKSLVDAFAQYARMPKPVAVALDLNALVAEVADLYTGYQRVEFDLAPDLPPVAADPALLRQVLVNLIKNAGEAVAESPEPRIVLRTEGGGFGVSFCVEDNGPGFPEALKQRLFEPYATTKAKGTGLGLAIVKKIVDEHHGSIEVRDLTPQGACVRIGLPLWEQEDE